MNILNLMYVFTISQKEFCWYTKVRYRGQQIKIVHRPFKGSFFVLLKPFEGKSHYASDRQTFKVLFIGFHSM